MSAHTTVQLSELIRQIPTEIVINTYLDRILILITQLGKIQASIPPTSQSSSFDAIDESYSSKTDTGLDLPQPSPAIELTVLLGVAQSEHLQTLHSAYASYVATLTWMIDESNGGHRAPVVVGIALRRVAEEEERLVFLEIMQKVKNLLAQRYVNTG